MGVTCTIFFDGQFWNGLFARVDDATLSAAKVVFGAEPKDQQVWEWVLANYRDLRFSPGVEAARETPIAANPKRRQRQVAKAAATGIGTKSQQAMQLAREENKLERRVRGKEQREAEAAYKLERHIEKKREKHKGH